MKTCPKCNKQVADDAAHCPYCGQRLGAGKTIMGMPSMKPGLGFEPVSTPGVAADPDRAVDDDLARGETLDLSAQAEAVLAGAPDLDDDDDDDDEEDGATVMLQGLSQQVVDSLLGDQVAGSVASVETAAMLPAQPSAQSAPQPKLYDPDDDDDDDDDDMPTMAIKALDLERLEAELAARKARDAAVAGGEPDGPVEPQGAVAGGSEEPALVPSPGAVPPPVAGLERDQVLAGGPAAPSREPDIAASPGMENLPTEVPPQAAAKPAPRAIPDAGAPEPHAARPKEPARKKGGAGKVVAVILVLLLLAVVGGGVGVYLLAPRLLKPLASVLPLEVKVKFETTVTHIPDDGEFRVTIKVRQDGGIEQPLVLEFEGESRTFEGEGSFGFTVSDEGLDVGSNVRKAVIRRKEGAEPLAEIPVDLFLNYRLKPPDTTIEPGQKELVVHVAIPKDAKVEVTGAKLEGEGPDTKLVVDLTKVVGPFDAVATPEFPLSLTMGLTFPDGRRVKETISLVLELPSAKLEAYVPLELITSRSRLSFKGMIHPDAVVTANGKDAEMWEDGEYKWSQPLKKGTQRIVLEATHEGRVPTRQVVQVTRVSEAKLKARRKKLKEEAEVWARSAMRAVTPSKLSGGADGELLGKKVVLRGKVHNVVSAKGTTVIVLKTCKLDLCTVLAKVEGPLDVLPGDEATVYGVVRGKAKYRVSVEEESKELQVPRLDAKYVVGK